MEEKADCSEVCVGGVGGGWLDHCAEKEGDALGSKYLGKAWGGGNVGYLSGLFSKCLSESS